MKKRDRTRPRPANITAEDAARRDKIRIGRLRWLGKPPGLPPWMVERVERRMAKGRTIEDLTRGVSKFYMVTYTRFNKHCELNPQWGERIFKLNKASITKKKKRKSIGNRLLTQEVCLKGLHPMKGNNLIVYKNGHRRCRECRTLTDSIYHMIRHNRDLLPEMKPTLVAVAKLKHKLKAVRGKGRT